MEAIEGGKIAALPGTLHPLAQARYDQGPLPGSTPLHGMSLDFGTTASQQAALSALLKAQQDPSSPDYRRWLTNEQFASEFGMTPADIARAASWLQSQGFTVDKVADSRNAIWFSGTAAQAEAAFHTSIHKYFVNGKMQFANAVPVSVPSALAGSVIRVGGLNDFKLRPQLVRPVSANKNGVTPAFTSGTTGIHNLQPGDYAVIYDMNPLYSANFTGAGVTIGVVGQTDIVMADITDFRSAARPALPAYGSAGGPTFTAFLIPGSADPGISYGDLLEADLDLEWSGGIATHANIVFVNSTDALTSMQYAIGNQINGLTIPILTVSYGGCEAAFSSSDITSLEASLMEADAQGQTVVSATGDSGAASCDDTSGHITSATHGLAVSYPASSAYVTGLGGSEFMGDGTAENPSTGADQYWSANGSNDVVTSALSYIPEMAWNDTTFNIANGSGLSAGGGGASNLFSKPSWQTGVMGSPADGFRDVPDVSIDASPDHDGYLFCTQVVLDSAAAGSYSSSCTNGFRISDPGYQDDGGLSIGGGTSFSAPSFAGILATIEQKLDTALGNINPELYTLASSSTTYAFAFHDITVGNNDVPCTSGTPDCPTSGTLEFGYPAGTGYDQATGLGSIDGNKLATAFATGVAPETVTTVTFYPATPVAETPVTLTATITADTGTATPAGPVVFTVDGTALPAIALSSGIAVTTTSFSTSGDHTVTAAYSPGTDNNFLPSAGTAAINVDAITTATSVTLSPSTTIALGSSLAITATVASSPLTGTLTGTVNFFAGASTTPLNATPIAISPGSAGTGTATYTVSNVQTTLGFVVGTTTITAQYTGGSAYAASTGTSSIMVTNPGLTITAANMTISSSSPGNSGTSAISVTSTGGYAGTVKLTANAPALSANITISPTSIAIANGGTGTATITVQTIAASGDLKHSTQAGSRRAIEGAAAALGCIFLLGIPAFRKKPWPMLTLFLLLGALGAGIGCGGGSSSSGGGGSSGAAPPGTYTVTVTATDSVTSAITTSTTFTVTIQ